MPDERLELRFAREHFAKVLIGLEPRERPLQDERRRRGDSMTAHEEDLTRPSDREPGIDQERAEPLPSELFPVVVSQRSSPRSAPESMKDELSRLPPISLDGPDNRPPAERRRSPDVDRAAASRATRLASDAMLSRSNPPGTFGSFFSKFARMPSRFLASGLLAAAVLPGFVACDGCRPKEQLDAGTAPISATPTARLYLVSDFAGALEPCGCVKDQRGGMDRFAALLAAESGTVHAPAAILAAGPLFYMDSKIVPVKAEQEKAKALAIAQAFQPGNRKDLPALLAFAPGVNDLAFGAADLKALSAASGATIVGGAGAGGTAVGAVGHVVREVGGIKIGILGAAAATPDAGTDELAATVKQELAAAKGEGAQTFVLLAAIGRGAAKRIADDVPELAAIVVGSKVTEGDSNTEAPPVERLGDTLIVETANHLQTVGVLDLYVRDGKYLFADASNTAEARKKVDLSKEIQDLRGKIADLADGPEADKKRAPLRDTLASKESELRALEKGPIPAAGSYSRFAMRDVRPDAGKDEGVAARMLSYYKKVDEDNLRIFATKMPLPPEKDGASYVGVEVCSSCHQDARKVWDKTAHAHAYKTLSDQYKAHNLDCVGCHVTGYDKPGGSTVAHVEKLMDVQCENCHGAGSKHAAAPKSAKIPNANPGADVCTTCHHPPHVHAFDVAAKRPLILGPGHGG
jgi:hypothetical protein